MATTVTNSSAQGPRPLSGDATTDTVAATSVVAQDEPSCEASEGITEKVMPPPRPLMIYTRPQILLLHRSPLVKPPLDMPSLRDWFGMENEPSKKEPEPSTSGSSRDRRYRRDAEDGENSSRPAFRSTLSQPSQMGNFKHQSLRASERERDRDRDTDKDRERDIRDKEGQERLRHLSDKYDRDRLALPSTLSNLRNKERDTAPHLTVGSSTRTSAQPQATNASSRRAEARDTTKKKAGESSEDWRRGAEPPRSGKEERERLDNTRKDRDERDGLRPHVRDRDPSASKRDRDREDRDRDRRADRDRDEIRKERDEFRRDKDDYSRRDRDPEREMELDDPRRWRDDGKRDERMAARRERDRTRDRVPHETGYDHSHDRHQDRRWTVAEERDGRSKRSSGRDRRSGGVAEDGKDDRKERERDKEKEPAWMETYIPNDLTTGILGGKIADGELDGIQAWKKELKEKGRKDKLPTSTVDNAEGIDAVNSKNLDGTEKQLDEIQLFKLMMKREAEKKTPKENAHTPISTLSDERPLPRLAEIIDQRNAVSTSTGDNVSPSILHVVESSSGQLNEKDATKPPLDAVVPKPPSSMLTTQSITASVTPSHDPRSLLSILTPPSSHEPGAATPKQAPLSLAPSVDKAKTPASRIFPNSISSESSSQPTANDLATPSTSSQFNPPVGSRLLAFGARAPTAASTKPETSNTTPHAANGMYPHPPAPPNTGHNYTLTNNIQGGGLSSKQQPSETSLNQGYSHMESAQQMFSPFGDRTHLTSALDESRETGHFLHPSDPSRRTSESSLHSELGNPGLSTTQSNSSVDLTNSTGAAQYASGKGSRFAKFFDGKAKDGPPSVKAYTPVGIQSSSPALSQKPDASGLNDVLGPKGDKRSMDDIFAMLSNSAQGQRVNMVDQVHVGSAVANFPFGQGHSTMHPLQHQQMLHQNHLSAGSRSEALYESRSDDRSFVPDGLVPGLRPARSRESSIFSESADDSLQFNAQRFPHPQRGVEQMYSSPFYQQTTVGRNVSIPLQQPPYRGGPSPISSQNPPQGLPQQRLPPGLANLGGRPPHEPSQFLGMPGMPTSGLHGTLHTNGSSQPFNTFAAPSGGSHGYGGGPHLRLPPPGPHQLQNALALNPVAGLGHPGNMDLRGPSHAHLLGMGGGIGGGLRGTSGFGAQQGASAPMQAPLLTVRQQHLPPHMIPHTLPPHLQPQANNQPAQDLMALLMGSNR